MKNYLDLGLQLWLRYFTVFLQQGIKWATSTNQQLMFADSLSDAISLIKAHEIEYMVKYISIDGKPNKLRPDSENKPLLLPGQYDLHVFSSQLSRSVLLLN